MFLSRVIRTAALAAGVQGVKASASVAPPLAAIEVPAVASLVRGFATKAAAKAAAKAPVATQAVAAVAVAKPASSFKGPAGTSQALSVLASRTTVVAAAKAAAKHAKKDADLIAAAAKRERLSVMRQARKITSEHKKEEMRARTVARREKAKMQKEERKRKQSEKKLASKFTLAKRVKTAKGKRGASGFALFIKAQSKVAPSTTLMKDSAAKWKTLSAEERQPFLEQAAKLKAERTERVGKIPKRPLSGYLRFFKDFRAKHPAIPSGRAGVTALAKEAGAAWKALPEDQKVPYLSAFAKEFTAYKAKLTAHLNSAAPLPKLLK